MRYEINICEWEEYIYVHDVKQVDEKQSIIPSGAICAFIKVSGFRDED